MTDTATISLPPALAAALRDDLLDLTLETPDRGDGDEAMIGLAAQLLACPAVTAPESELRDVLTGLVVGATARTTP